MIGKPALLTVAAFGLVSAGCADTPEPAPRPNAAELERLLASVEAEAGLTPAPQVSRKVTAADRVSAVVGRASPEKVDPNFVATIIAR
jgi:hypothetical protein